MRKWVNIQAFEGYFKSQLRAADKFVILLFMLKGTVWDFRHLKKKTPPVPHVKRQKRFRKDFREKPVSA